MHFWLNISQSLSAIRENALRAIITLLIIAFGITALVGILTAIDGVESSISKNFSFMGANTFNVQNRSSNVSFSGEKRKVFPHITYREAKDFKEEYPYPAAVSIFADCAGSSVAKYRENFTNPNTWVLGGDEAYIRVSGYELEEGRNITAADVDRNIPVALIGQEIKSQLFPNESPLEKEIRVSGIRFRVVGVLKEKGSAFDFGGNRIIVIPISRGRQHFLTGNNSYTIGVSVEDIQNLPPAVEAATGQFRISRGLSVKEENDFEIVKSDDLSKKLIENLMFVRIAAIFIAIITLVGAAIGLMNIMLVSVTERTREIGVRKALGAKPAVIMNQFLMEALMICQLGGAVGVLAGITLGNVVSNLIGGKFIVPWNWIIIALIVCVVVGVLAGYWPARKASRTDPIIALRHE